MAPPGVHSFDDHLIMTFESNFSSNFSSLSPWSPPMKIKSSFQHSSSLSSSSSLFSSEVRAIHADHDYIMKPPLERFDFSLNDTVSSKNGNDIVNNGSDESDDVIPELGDSTLDLVRFTAEIGDADFLHELDDLNFGLDDLDPFHDVEMENSFQDFIDSALDQSPTSHTNSDLRLSHSARHQKENGCAVILNKENFLGLLDLRPSSDTPKVASHMTPSSASHPTENTSTNTTSPFHASSPQVCLTSPSASSSPSSSVLEVSSTQHDLIPTKRCSCLRQDQSSSAIYSTAHSPSENDVRVCPSTVNSRLNKMEDETCSEYFKNRLVSCSSDKLLGQLTIDTSYGNLDSPQGIPADCFDDMMMDYDTESSSDRDTDDFFQWLNDGQQQQQQEHQKHQHQYSGKNYSNIKNSFSSSGISSANSGEHPVIFSAETPSRGCVTSAALDLDDFIDLEELASHSDAAHAEQKQQHSTPNSFTESHDHTYQRLACIAKDDKDSFCSSNLKFSFLADMVDLSCDNGKTRTITDAHAQVFGSPDSFRSENSPNYVPGRYGGARSDLSSRSRSNSFASSASSPSPMTPFYEDQVFGPEEKGHLALLNLFADENMAFALHGDTDIRFM